MRNNSRQLTKTTPMRFLIFSTALGMSALVYLRSYPTGESIMTSLYKWDTTHSSFLVPHNRQEKNTHIVYTNQILMDEKFRKAQSLMVSTDMGLKAITEVDDTEKKTIKQCVYFVLVDDSTFFTSEGNHAFTVTFDSKAISNGKYTGVYKKGNAKVQLKYSNDKITTALERIDFSTITNHKVTNGNVSVVFVNKHSNDRLSTVSYSNTLYHELQAHIVRNMNIPATSIDRSENKDHEEYHGTTGRSSPAPGNEKKGSIMNQYLDQAKKSYLKG